MSRTVSAWDKILPNQAFNADQYRGQSPIEKSLYENILRCSGLGVPQVQFQIEETELYSIEEMASNAIALGFIAWLLRLTQARRVLEIGTFVGVSAMSFARALPPDGHVLTVEKFDHFAAIARRNFAANGLDGQIALVEGDALEVLPGLKCEAPFDFAFIDGNKERYAEYFTLIEPMMAPRGLIAIDDAFFHGDALNDEPQTEKGRGVRAVLDLAAARSDWRRIALPISNGLLLMFKSEFP